MFKGKHGVITICLAILLSLTPVGSIAMGEQAEGAGSVPTVQTTSASDAIAKLGVLKGDGQGVTDAYLSRTTTRIQAAILQLRLIGKEQEAASFAGMNNFKDSARTGKANRPFLAYLKAHPELGWNGTENGEFLPNAPLTPQQLYKVMLELLRYRSGMEFAYKDTLTFAASIGIFRAAAVTPFTNRDLAIALAETLQAKPKGAESTLLQELVDEKVVDAEKAKLLGGARIDVRKAADGSEYLTDGHGMTLYLFTKDMADLSTCQGACLTNWPVFYSDRLILPEGAPASDFGVSVRSDGAKQLTYKGWPLYYFAKDAKAGDTNGEAVNNVWYSIKQPFYSVVLGTDANLGNYLVDDHGVTLYYFDKDPKGSSVCAGDCLAKWPVFHAKSVVAPKGVNSSDFGEITRSDGVKQTTFKGYPLYYFFQDSKRGGLKGQGVGNVWFVLNPATFAGTTAGNATPAAEPVTDKVTIEMKDFSFTPTKLTVKAGTTIEFVNRDDMKHNAVAVDGSFKIDLLDKGQSATIKLDKPGTYEYYCEPHKSFMRGTITVQ
ncbi:plastocyanin/azurin family copper-binding protein [Cohnella soli]|uniref:Plastocyanin/azurin family copper-binding protein n=1 Tax=Cohnella soli TaxID=425005 RepID=A0ABW0HSZ4_9BACL